VVPIGSATLEICINNFTQFSFVHFASFAVFFAEIASLIGLLLYSIWSRLWLYIKALGV
jgi:hypothetical protein